MLVKAGTYAGLNQGTSYTLFGIITNKYQTRLDVELDLKKTNTGKRSHRLKKSCLSFCTNYLVRGLSYL